MKIYGGGQMNIQGCNITSNSAQDFGGGICFDLQNAHPPKSDNKSSVKGNTPDNCHNFASPCASLLLAT